ncbi:acyl-CoA thioester hydrolase/BAAT C-terminal domain-containing protein [Fundicoccus culcitae]|uniref:Acyl-CoA thioesterase n=1 Tax=Fundicoccus culcitae TaxID=2969821 RepID=A0ABY5P9T8_9LACT|nr:acyl-CoA thioester hydrolase/BAAT C-terminal domain-containing protein [Fundicoccus culcitae]UUX35193.1 acyl-CoA thioesterase [Fundicoccus culcitae]
MKKSSNVLSLAAISILLLILNIAFMSVAPVYASEVESESESQVTTDEEQDYQPAPYVLNPRDLSLYPTEFEGGTIEHIEGDYMNGFHMIPDEKLYEGTIIIFGGSEGTPQFDLGVGFASAGYEVFSMFFFGMENQQPELAEVPLEFFQEILDYYQENGGSLDEPITVYGASKGAELALNLGTLYEEIDNLVLMAPSAYNYFGLNMAQEDLSSWTYEGQPLPFLSVTNATEEVRQEFLNTMQSGKPIAYVDVYESAITNTEEDELEEKRIKVEDFDGELLIFAGNDDQLWPSALMAEVIAEHATNEANVNIYQGAGHVFFGNGEMELPEFGTMLVGGTEEANLEASQAYFATLIEVVNGWHSATNE